MTEDQFTVTIEVVPPAGPDAAPLLTALEMLAVARSRFAGACLMPPFDHYDVLFEILKDNR
ncbi:MAG: hypothetical protein GY850_45865 [bacterium]|nr:hypothetical protein [bacterium]